MQIFNDGSSKKPIPGQTSSHDEGVHSEMVGTAVMNSPRIAPVNLAMSFADEEECEEKFDCPSSPWASNESAYEPTDTDKAKHQNFINKFRKQYSVQEAWAKGNIAKYHWKLSGRQSSDFKFLFPCLECSTCSFPNIQYSFQLMKNHTPMCVQTQMSFLMVTLYLPLHLWYVIIIIPRPQQFQSSLGRMCHSLLM